MSKNNDDMLKVRDCLRETADIIDEIIELEERANNGEDVEKELESVMGRYLLKLVELNSL